MNFDSLVGKAFALCYGTVNLAAFLVLSVTNKSSFRKLGPVAKKELAAAREKLWDLDRRPFGLDHRFCVLSNAVKLHYVQSAPKEPTGNLVVFIHGYPDSWALWQHYLANPRLASKATLIAVDLPGYGGSDSLENYGPDQVMEAMAEFLIKMREEHVLANGRTVIVGHDWGAVVGFRLATEAAPLGDRFIMSNSVHMPVAYSNVLTKLSSAKLMARTWLRAPLNLRPIREALLNIAPVTKQLYRSGYVFAFNLPFTMLSLLAGVGDFWWFRYVNAMSVDRDPVKPLKGSHGAEMLASTVGPSARECIATNNPELTYSASVRKRAFTGGFLEKVCLYRHGLASGKWEKSLETLWSLNQISQRAAGRRRSSSSAGIFDTGPEGSLQGPTTIIWGKGDVALDRRIAVEGFKDFFGARGSQIVTVGNCGHWAPVEKQAVPIFDAVIDWSITGEKRPLKHVLGDDFPLAQIVAER